MGSLLIMKGSPDSDTTDTNMQVILQEYNDLFEVATEQPPSRAHDHKIILKEGTSPINIRPYMYPTVQKDEIEKLVIKYYRELNNCTVKDMFSIQVIEKLLDELHGAKFFSKLDLRLGYQQIRMIEETDASENGIGVVLAQGTNPTTFFSQGLSYRCKSLFVYERELLTVVSAVRRLYLLRRHFVIKTDHHSLIFLLDQRITTSSQLKGLVKLLGYDYSILYNKGKDNIVVDALSRKEDPIKLLSISSVQANLLSDIRSSWSQDSKLQKRCKHKNVAYPGLLQPLPIPDKVCQDLSMNFIEGLPKVAGKGFIFVVVDRLSKTTYFIALKHPYIALDVAQVFMSEIFRLHGMPKSIMSDRDSVSTSRFWNKLFKLQKVSLLTSTAYHLQTDGQTEIVNKCLECYLRCMTYEKPKECPQCLALVEWWYNTSHHSSINMSPYEVVSFQAREATLRALESHFLWAQTRIKAQAYKGRTYKFYDVGDGVGAIAYALALSPSAKLHPTYYISQLKKKIGSQPASMTLLVVTSVAVIQWLNSNPEDITSEDYESFTQAFPLFDP
ncbi:hypothetical protein KY290_037036 [Solanum tuberosum]|uniref:Integrase catalytic domain-containing protein n=1 Tax=Solanum tuberosum TaxID=4113 RepID=A0ABQ7TW34_SOLTU|nr:hypothetical protein KY290_037036 [Solanum tuberosum]